MNPLLTMRPRAPPIASLLKQRCLVTARSLRTTNNRVTTPVYPQSISGIRQASSEAGEQKTGHLSTGPNEALLFFDSGS